jgi:hypothetical protein
MLQCRQRAELLAQGTWHTLSTPLAPLQTLFMMSNIKRSTPKHLPRFSVNDRDNELEREAQGAIISKEINLGEQS